MWNTAAEKTQTQRIIFKKNNNNCSRNNSTRDEGDAHRSTWHFAHKYTYIAHTQQTQWKQNSGFIKCHSRCLIWSFLSISSFYSLADSGLCLCMCLCVYVQRIRSSSAIYFISNHPHPLIHSFHRIYHKMLQIHPPASSFLLQKRKSNAYNRHCRFDVSHFAFRFMSFVHMWA